MKELKTITEYQLLCFAYHALSERILYEQEINKITKKERGREDSTCQSRLKMYNEQLAEVCGRILEIENNNAE